MGPPLPRRRVELVLSGGERVVRAALKIHPDAPTVKKVGQVPVVDWSIWKVGCKSIDIPVVPHKAVAEVSE